MRTIPRHITKTSFKSGKRHHDWKGGTSDYWHREARKIMNCPKGKIVHHKDGNVKNNNKDNLMILTQNEHVAIHNRQRKELERKKPVRQKHFKRIIELTKQKKSSREIARELNIAKNTVLRARKDAGIKVVVLPGVNKIMEVNYEER